MSTIAYQNIERYKQDIDWMNHSNEILKSINEVKINIVDLHYEAKSYLATRQKNYFPIFDSLSRKLESDLKVLNDLTVDNPDQKNLLNNLEKHLSENIFLINSLVSDTSNSLGSERSPARKQLDNEIRVNLDIMNVLTNELKSNELYMLNSRSDRADRSNSRVQNFIIITGLFSFTALGLSLLFSGRLIKNKMIAEELLLKSYEELEDRVEERTEELMESNTKLSGEIMMRKKTEETLRESEHRFRMMADSAAVLIWLSGKDKLYTYFNQAWLDFTGRSMEEELGNGWIEGLHTDDLEDYIKTYNESFDKRTSFEIEYRLRNYLGDYLWILVKGVPRFEGEEFAGYIGSCIDINERKKNENFLNVQYKISKTLADSESIEEASRKLLKNICAGIDWSFGILWIADETSDLIRAEYLWSQDEGDEKLYSELFSESFTFAKGKGFPGSVFKEGRSLWTKDLINDKDFIRKEAVSKLGWNSRLGIPISNGNEIIAIIECFNKKSIEEKQDMINVLESAGRQIGNFIERKRAEYKLKQSNQELEERVTERTNELATALSKLIKESEEKELIQNRIKLFAHTIRSIQDSIFIADLNNEAIFVNNEFKLTYGYEESEIIGKEIPALKDVPGNLKRDIFEKSLRDGWKGELMTFRSDGTSFHTYLSTSSIKNEEGEADAWVGICQDITELKKNEELVIKRNSLLNVLNDVIQHSNSSFDFNSSVQYSINKICEHTSWEIGHFLMKVEDTFIPSNIWSQNIPEEYELFKKTTEGFVFEDGILYPWKELKNGKPVWMILSQIREIQTFKRAGITDKLGLKTGIWAPVLAKGIIIGAFEFFKKEEELPDQEILACIKNIGVELGSLFEKLEIINQLKKNEKDLKEAQNIAKVGSWEWDVLKNRLSWSDELYNIYELDKNKSEITYDEYIERLHPDDRDLAVKTIQYSIENKCSFNYYHRVFTAMNTEKVLKARGEVYLDDDGRVIRMFGTAQDVTEIQNAEEELRRINAQLIDTQKELIYNEKLAALGRFSSGIAHEIRNPLANINSLAQMLSKSTSDEKDKKKLNYILTNVDMADKIIKSLLNYASPEDLTFSEVKLSELISGTIESVIARADESGIFLEKEIEYDIPVMMLDRLKLENAFMNFISNSIDAMPEGGTLKIRVTSDKPNEVVNIDFIDSGIGIPSANLDKILEPFFTTKDDGTGLGLGLAYQTIRLHGGTFSIQSKVGTGTQVNIKLPFKQKTKN